MSLNVRVFLAFVCAVAGACDNSEAAESPPAAEQHGDAAETGGGASAEPEVGGHGDDDLEFDEDPSGASGAGGDVDPAVAEVRDHVTKAFHGLTNDRLEVDKARADVETAKAELDARLAGLAALEKRLDERLGAGDVSRKRRDRRISVLAKLILAMPPQAAAQMVGQMSDADAQAIVLAMSGQNERKASKLLAALPGARAASLGQLYLDHDPKTLVGPGAAPPPAAAPALPASAASAAPASARPDTPADASPGEPS